MERQLLIRFNGCLNGKRKITVDLLLLKFMAIGSLSIFELSDYLYQKRGKGQLGPKNGPGTAGWLEVIKVNNFKSRLVFNDCKTVTVTSFAVKKIYEQIKDELKLAISEKIKIQKKEIIEEKPNKRKKKKKKGVKNVIFNKPARGAYLLGNHLF